MKKYISGLITGIIITLTLSSFAAGMGGSEIEKQWVKWFYSENPNWTIDENGELHHTPYKEYNDKYLDYLSKLYLKETKSLNYQKMLRTAIAADEFRIWCGETPKNYKLIETLSEK